MGNVGMELQQCIMQQTTIQFGAAILGEEACGQTVLEGARVSEVLGERTRLAQQRVKAWYHGTAKVYSRLLGETITRKAVIRFHVILMAILVAAVCVEQAPLMATGSAAVAGWVTYLLNKTDGQTTGKEACHA